MDTGILGAPLSRQCFRGRRPTGGQQTGGFCGILCLNVKTTERTRQRCQGPIRTRSRGSRWSAFVRTDTSRACRPAPSSSRKNSSDTSIRRAHLGHHHGRFSSPAELIRTFLERAGSRAFDIRFISRPSERRALQIRGKTIAVGNPNRRKTRWGSGSGSLSMSWPAHARRWSF